MSSSLQRQQIEHRNHPERVLVCCEASLINKIHLRTMSPAIIIRILILIDNNSSSGDDNGNDSNSDAHDNNTLNRTWSSDGSELWKVCWDLGVNSVVGRSKIDSFHLWQTDGFNQNV